MTDSEQILPQTQYDEDNIKYLEGIEHIRLRPGMYVGGKDIRALHHLIYEVVDNSIDEALAGRCDKIMVTLYPDHSVSVSDNGVGIPVGIQKQTGKSALEGILTKIGMGGKFDSNAYKVSGGLHGVGLTAVNALSAELRAEVYRDGHLWQQIHHRGVPSTSVEKMRPLHDGETTGTTITFRPDFTVLDDNEFSYDTLAQRFREMAFVTRKVSITVRDERIQPIPRETTFYFEGGLKSFVKYLNRYRKPLHDPVYGEKDVEIAPENKSTYNIGVEIAFQYNDTSNITELAFANTIGTPDGGTHLTGIRSAITSVINRYARKAGFLKEKDSNFSGNDTLEGITAIVSVKHPDPSFESQTKVKLLNPEVQGAVSQVCSEAFNDFLELNPREARKIIDKCMTSKRAREAARKARDLVRSGPSLLESSTLPGKLADCSTIGPNAEIYIVEGDSAGGCFSGDTQIALTDGRQLSFSDIIAEQAAGKTHFCYTIRADHSIGIEQVIHPRMTKKNADVIRVTLDNGESITCTPDHLFMLRDGTYKPAHQLTPSDALMPLYRQSELTSDKVWNPASHRWEPTAELSQTSNGVISDDYRQTLETLKNAQWVNGTVNVTAFAEHYFNANAEQALEAVTLYNHRIVSIETVAQVMDVYDIEVPHTHNFALASGVFVHNSAKQGRDRHFQAILPLRGKILNTERAGLDKILDSNEIKALISALGTGIHEDFNVEKIRYGRVIVMTDADVDGSHIRTLLLTFFYRHMHPLVQHGHLYIAQPPIYLLKAGKEQRYIYPSAGLNDAQVLEKAMKDWGKDPAKVGVQRYKGLGEMNPEQLWDTTMNPETRTLLQVTIEDAVEADKVFDMLMGNSVPPRRKFIQSNAKSVKNLDI